MSEVGHFRKQYVFFCLAMVLFTFIFYNSLAISTKQENVPNTMVQQMEINDKVPFSSAEEKASIINPAGSDSQNTTESNTVISEKVTQKKMPVSNEEAWDSVDGIGYNYEKKKEIVMDLRFEALSKIPQCNLTVDSPEPKVDLNKLKNAFLACIVPIVEQWRNKPKAMNVQWEKTAVCDDVFNGVDIEPMANSHEIKWTILPNCREENKMVTLGVGHDTLAEEKLNRTLPNTTFVGADPVINPNRQLYTRFGQFFPFAIGRRAGFTKFRILPNQHQSSRNYEFQDVTTVPLTFFLSDILKLKKIDFFWIDIEGGEFEFLDLLHQEGRLDTKGIVICQMNLEIHSKFHKHGSQIFYDFVWKLLDEKRYLFLKPARTDKGVHRMFLFNVENRECIRKFLE